MGRKKKEFVQITDKKDLMLPIGDTWRECRLNKDVYKNLRGQKIKYTIPVSNDIYGWDSDGKYTKLETQTYTSTYYGVIYGWNTNQDTKMILFKKEHDIPDKIKTETWVTDSLERDKRWNKIGCTMSMGTGHRWGNQHWNECVEPWIN